jgi:hypothetical protein
MTSPDKDSVVLRGEKLLTGFMEQAALDMAVLADFGKQQHLTELGQRLRKRMQSEEGYPNKAYNGLAFEGIRRFDVLVSGLADDHDYVFNEHTLTIEVQGPGSQHALGLTPVRFLALVVAAQEGAPPVGRFSR